MLNTNDQDIKTAEYLKSAGISYDVQLLAEMLHDKEWQHDLFYVTFKNNKGKLAGFEYKTGIGHRMNPPAKNTFSTLSHEQTKERKILSEVIGKNPLIVAKHATSKRPVSQEWVTLPTQASVLYGLILDASANDESFTDWCDNYGYDSDSIKAQGIYNACIDNAKKLNEVFSRNQLDKISELLEDY